MNTLAGRSLAIVLSLLVLAVMVLVFIAFGSGDAALAQYVEDQSSTVSVGESAYTSSLPGTGVPLMALAASGLVAAGVGALIAGNRRR